MGIDSNILYLTNFVQKKFPEADAALLTGSFGTKAEKNNSDIDIIIFSKSVSKSFVEKFIMNSKKIDVIYMSTNYNFLLKELYLDINSRFGVYFNMLKTSRILFDNNKILDGIISFSQNNLLKEYLKIERKEIEFRMKLISNAIEDVKDIDQFGEFFFVTSLILEEITNILLSLNLTPIGRGKNKARALKSLDLNFYNKTMNSIMNFNKEEFVKILTDKMECIGGISEKYSLKNIPSINTDLNTKYEIRIKRKYFIRTVFLKNLDNLNNYFKKNNINLLYFYFENDSFVLVIQALEMNNQLTKSILFWVISNFKIDLIDKVVLRKMSTKLLPFVNSKLNIALEKDLIFFTKILIEKKEFKNDFDFFKLNYYLINLICKDLFGEGCNTVFEYLYESNILKNIDINGNELNYFQLIERKGEIVKEIEIFSKSILLLNNQIDKDYDFYSSLEFLNTLKSNDDSDLNVLKSNLIWSQNRYANDINSTHLILTNFYLNYIIEIFNDNNQISIIANILRKKS